MRATILRFKQIVIYEEDKGGDMMDIYKRLEEIKQEHDEIVNRTGEYNNALQQLNARRLQLEGAFNELQELLNDPESKEENRRE